MGIGCQLGQLYGCPQHYLVSGHLLPCLPPHPHSRLLHGRGTGYTAGSCQYHPVELVGLSVIRTNLPVLERCQTCNPRVQACGPGEHLEDLAVPGTSLEEEQCQVSTRKLAPMDRSDSK